MEHQVLAIAKVNWLSPDKGGRSQPPFGSIYAATARFVEQDELFSVVLHFLTKNTSHMHSLFQTQQYFDKAELGFLAPELIEKRLAPGKKLLLTEGPRTVAECEIQSVIRH